MQWFEETLARAGRVSLREPAFRFHRPSGALGVSAPSPFCARPSDPTSLLRSQVLSLQTAYKAGRSTPNAVVEAAIERGQQATQLYGAFLDLWEEDARQAAESSKARFWEEGPRSPLDGVPIALKDVIDVAGYPTAGGSPLFRHRIAHRDGHCVEKLRQAGAILLGKTALHEWAYGVTSDNPHFGRVRNPVDPDRIPGGSSGGSAAAVAGHVVPVALGSDTGGSIRIPAACCGLVGFKPSYDVISREGGVPQAWSLDHLGPLATCVTDAWLATAAASEGADADYSSILAHCTDVRPSLKGIRLGVLQDWEQFSDTEVFNTHANRLLLLREAGADLIPFRYPDTETAQAAWLTIIVAESAAYHTEHLRRQPNQISPDVRGYLEMGQKVSAREYLRAQQIRAEWLEAVSARMSGIDAIVSPSLPTPAPKFGETTLSLQRGPTSLRDAFVAFQWPANLLGAPSISLPGRLSPPQLPQGLLLTGQTGHDAGLLQCALIVERCLTQEGSS